MGGFKLLPEWSGWGQGTWGGREVFRFFSLPPPSYPQSPFFLWMGPSAITHTPLPPFPIHGFVRLCHQGMGTQEPGSNRLTFQHLSVCHSSVFLAFLSPLTLFLFFSLSLSLIQPLFFALFSTISILFSVGHWKSVMFFAAVFLLLSCVCLLKSKAHWGKPERWMREEQNREPCGTSSLITHQDEV